ncbi:MAG: U32 family peptidase, partial [Bacilli bacterium]
MKKVELLSPAGSIERLKIALLYGADAIYIGGRDYSLRANAKNFSLDEIKEACEYAHKLNKRVYVTVNIVFHNEDIKGLVDYLKELEKCQVDAVIISDPLVINIIHENKIKIPIHISTQYSSVNYEVVNFWKKLGVERVVLGRETSKEEIKEIIDRTGMDIEIFIHGAMCASYSGRCVLSNYLTNRDANRGGCAQICRWNFDLEKDGDVIPSDTKFTMCSKDLCMLEVIPDVIDIGVCSLKVEGRMRSIYYIATVINTYRRAIDDYYNGMLDDKKIKKYLKVLNRVANRDNAVQFFDKFPTEEEQYFGEREEVSNQDYLGIVDDYDGEYVSLITKNFFKPGDEVEIISPDKETFSFVVPEIYDNELNILDCARHPEEIIKFKLDKDVSKYDMMRIKIK